MITLLLIVQFTLVVVICIAVLLQKSSSIGLGAYSGSNESLFGAKGPAGFLAKFTFIMGVALIANTIALGYLYNQNSKSSLAEQIQIPSNENNSTNVPSAPAIPMAPSIPMQNTDQNNTTN
ncbi:preprotein translocase subunit SecG [Campylobacter sp. US33a]|uniref:Protein-export membrane protein SecG n=1 Tax=Campylobacter sp. CCS1377 TaxID=3158229 RepID=A0AAU7E7Z7_9BACT|nr:preprotein translocase subunit SecG [Campylobacter sp. US33a]MCW1359829.1 preprotein translocase subunit SecG [Campylobacter jejuni]TEY03092.1 preprotein translocase subunit SecG [Campylobacter sp. US33a]